MGVFTKNDDTITTKHPKEFTTIVEGKEKNDESKLERLIFEHPKIFPVDEIADVGKWIPLATQIEIKGHGILDILATDSDGNIYIVECKLRYNSDMKTIRGQITDYAAGLWNRIHSDDSDESKFENFWKWFCDVIEKNSTNNQKLEVILQNADADVDQTMDMMKNNFKENKTILVYAVDRITEGVRTAVHWHNTVVNTKNNYPTFALEVRKYAEENENSELIVTQTFPLDLKELKRKNNTKSKRVKNDKVSWTESLKRKNLKTESQIIDVANNLEKLVEKNGGYIDWGSGSINPRMMPKFANFSERSAIGLKANGELVFQFHLIQGIVEYENAGKEWETKLNKVDELQKIISGSKSKGEPRIGADYWLPHKDKILSILKEIFVKE